MKQLALFILLQLADIGTTGWLYHCVGCNPIIESNPVARAVLAAYGIAGLCVLKAGGLALLLAIWYYLPGAWRVRALDVGNGMMLGVVAGNCYLMTLV